MKRDDQIFNLIEAEHKRQLEGMELIASENFVSPQVMEAMGSYLTNKYARLSRSPLLRRLPGSRPGRNTCNRESKKTVRRRICERTATLRRTSKCGCIIGSA